MFFSFLSFRNFVVLALLSVFATTLQGQTEIAPYRPGMTTEGITYFLPQTGLHIVVRAKKRSYQPGDYSAWAERFLEIKGVGQEKADTWSIIGMTVQPYGVADRSKAYTIKLDHRSSAPLVSLAPDGVLLGVNTRVAPLPVLEQASVKQEHTRSMLDATHKTQEIIRATSMAKKAELTAQEIYDLRENRNLLAKGQAEFQPKDGEQLRLMLAKLDEQEQALTRLFLGTSIEEEHVFTFDYLPTEIMEQVELFRFSKHLGLLEAGDLAGDPIYLSMTLQNILPSIDEKALAKRENKKQDLRYCNPNRARVQLFGKKRSYYDASLPFAQFGRIEHLGGELFNRKFEIQVMLSPITGALEHLDRRIKQ